MALADKAPAPWLQLEMERQPGGKFKIVSSPSRRPCGDCTLCCKVIPVEELGKPANRWCDHAEARKGCTIYADRPNGCRFWSCAWAATPEWPEALKPNKTHVIFDMFTDTLRFRRNSTGEVQEFSAIQLWVDPAYPAAHRAPLVRQLIEIIGQRYGLPTLVRFGSKDGIFVVPPSLSSDGGWYEKPQPATPVDGA